MDFLSFFLQNCTIVSLRCLGLGAYSLKSHATLLNAFLINDLMLLLSVPATLHFMVLLFRDAFNSTALLTQLLQFENGCYISMMMRFAILEFVFIAFFVISVLANVTSYSCKPLCGRRRVSPAEEVIEVNQGTVRRWSCLPPVTPKPVLASLKTEYTTLLDMIHNAGITITL